MVDLIYDFIRNTFIGSESTLSGADNLALLLTWSMIVMMFLLFVKVVFWAFNLSFSWTKRRGRRN